MVLLQLPLSYLLWHYSAAWADLVRLYRNLAWFLWNFFSVELLFRTLFSPWHRIREHADKDTAGLLGSLIMGLILRCIGFVMRIFTILSGLAALILLTLLFPLCIGLWLVMPAVVLGSMALGIAGLIILLA